MVELASVPVPGSLKSSKDKELFISELVDWARASLYKTIMEQLNAELATAAASGPGETNTGSNLGSGSNVFKQKTGVDLEFRSVTGSAGIADTSSATEVDLELEIDTLTQLAEAPADDDRFLVYDLSATANKYIEAFDMLSVGNADSLAAVSAGSQGQGQPDPGVRLARYTTGGAGFAMTLPDAQAGDVMLILNDTGAELKVWSNTGDTVEGGTSVTMAIGDRAQFVSMSASTWYQTY